MTTLAREPESTRGQLGQDIYSAADLRLYVAYYGEPQDGDRAMYWLREVLNPVAHRVRQPDYSFSDLVSLFVVRELLRLNVAPRTIREAEQYTRRRFRTDRPFVSEEVATDGRDVFVRSDVEEQIEAASRGGGQQAARKIIGPHLHHVRYHEASAVAWCPAPHIVLNPAVQFGEPVIERTRVPTSAVAEVADAAGPAEAANRLGVSLRRVRTALAFERELAALRD